MQETLHLLARNSRESSSRGYSLRSGQASLFAEPVSSLHTGTASSVNGHIVSPVSPAFQKAQRAQQPSLLDLCPTVFGAISPDLHDHHYEGAAQLDEVPGTEDEPQQACLSAQSPNSRALSLTSLCPSIEHLLDGAEDAPIEAVCSHSSRSSSPCSSTVLHPKGDTNPPQSMLDLQPSVIGCFGSSSSDKSSNAPGPDPDETETDSGLSACLRSTILAFHQGPEPGAVSEPSLATTSDSGAGAVTVFCHGVAATLPRDQDMLNSMRAGNECTDELSRSMEFGIQSSGLGLASTLGGSGGLTKASSSLQYSHSMCASVATHAMAGDRDDCDSDGAAPLRRAKSLAPTRRSMLTPAADCNGGHLLPEVPALQTYKNARPPRPRRAHFKSTVVILDNPTINVFEADAHTASMTVSAVSQPRSDSVQHRRRQRNRRRGSYMHMRSALDYVELGSHAEPRLEPLQESRSGLDSHATQASSPDEPFPCRDAAPRATTASVAGHSEPKSLSGIPCPIGDIQVYPLPRWLHSVFVQCNVYVQGSAICFESSCIDMISTVSHDLMLGAT